MALNAQSYYTYIALFNLRRNNEPGNWQLARALAFNPGNNLSQWVLNFFDKILNKSNENKMQFHHQLNCRLLSPRKEGKGA